MDSINELAEALSKAQAKMRPAVRSSSNPHYKSRYADLASIWDAVRQPLAENGLAVIQLPVSGSDEGRIGLTTILIHKSGQSISSTFYMRPQQDTPQAIGSALTYLRRYGLSAIVGAVAEDDDDGNAASLRPRPLPAEESESEMSRIERRWGQLANEAASLGVSIPAVDKSISLEEWKAAGKRLAAAVAAARQAVAVKQE